MNEECKKPYLKLVSRISLITNKQHVQDEIRLLSKKDVLTIFHSNITKIKSIKV